MVYVRRFNNAVFFLSFFSEELIEGIQQSVIKELQEERAEKVWFLLWFEFFFLIVNIFFVNLLSFINRAEWWKGSPILKKSKHLEGLLGLR